MTIMCNNNHNFFSQTLCIVPTCFLEQKCDFVVKNLKMLK